MARSVLPCTAVVVAMLLVALLCLLPHTASHHFLREYGERLGLGYAVLPPREVFTVVGAGVGLPCEPIITEKGVPTVSWWNRDGEVLNDTRRMVLSNGSLSISRFEEEDVGVYRCILSLNTTAVTSAPIVLRLAMKGKWQIAPRNSTVIRGSAVRITCLFSSLPPASYTWLRDGQPLPQDARYYHPRDRALQITNVTYEDAGVYRCKVFIPLLKEEVLSPGGYLMVKAPRHRKPTSAAIRPSLLSVPSRVIGEVGKRSVLECLTDDVNMPELQWSRMDDLPIRTEGVRREGQKSLVFLKVREEDAGVYNCSVLVDSNIPVTQIIELEVLSAPTVKLSMMIHNIPKKLFDPAVNGGSVRITCESQGNAVPGITWYKDGHRIVETDRHRLFSTSSRLNASKELAIINLMAKDRGVYQCICENRVGVASEGLLLTIHLPPDMPKAPVNIRLQAANAYGLDIAWSQPSGLSNNTDTLGYILHYKNLASDDNEVGRVTNKTYFKLKKLQPYSNYSIYIRTFIILQNSRDPIIGEPSEYLVFRTKATYPSRMPKVKLQPLSPTELHVSWEPLNMTAARGPVTQQSLQWRKKMHYYDSKTLPVNLTEFTIEGLQPSKRYEVRVLVSTEVGYPQHQNQLPWEPVKMPRVNDDNSEMNKPFDVQLFVFSHKPTEIKVEWTLDMLLVENIYKYMVSYNDTPRRVIDLVPMPPNTTSHTLTDLDPQTCYSVSVMPHYSEVPEGGGVGTIAHSICTFPLDILPHLPNPIFSSRLGVKKVKVKVLNTTSILVTWRPRRRKVVIDFFTVRILSLGNQRLETPQVATAPAGTPKDTDKDPGHQHQRASLNQPQPPEGNASQIGVDGSWLLRRRTRDGRTRIDQDAVLPDNAEDTHIQGYQDTGTGRGGDYRQGTPRDEEVVRFIRVTQLQATVVDLKPLHSYEVTITASTITLTSHPSTAKHVTTKEGVPTAPLNVSYHPMSPKDVTLSWSRPSLTNGRLTAYLVTYSHNLVEWRNISLPAHLTTVEIQDLVSNTNYTLKIAGVTGGGVGSYTTIYVYISATLILSSSISTELVVICVVCILAVLTCVVVGLLCLRILRMRHSSPSVFQGNGTCRMVYANGVKSSGREHGTELHDYKPMLASLPPATHNHHLDTKASTGNEKMDSIPDGIANHHHHHHHHCVMATLDDLDDGGDDASRHLLQNISPQPVFSSSSSSKGITSSSKERETLKSTPLAKFNDSTGSLSNTPICPTKNPPNPKTTQDDVKQQQLKQQQRHSVTTTKAKTSSSPPPSVKPLFS